MALYAPTLGRGIVNYDDPWLVRDNDLLGKPSAGAVSTVLFDMRPETRFALGAEYLPVRDLSIMADRAIWGDWYPGYHLTNLVLYLAAIALWSAALVALGLDRTLAGLAILIWAIAPAHAESVAWISERKGLLGLAFSGAAAFGYLRFRAGRHAGWLALALVATACAVWSKAPFAFAIAVLAALELVAPAPRRSWRRSLVGLGAIATIGLAAFVPVLVTAMNLAVVGGDDHAPAGWLAMAVGLHGFYLELGAMAVRNAVSYPIGSIGPSAIQLALGALGLVAALAVTVVPARGPWQPPRALRIGALIWLFGWLPASRLVLPLRAVLVADRYILFASLGLAIALAVGLLALPASRARTALIGVVCVVAAVRTLDAQAGWADSLTLWERAARANPIDGNAWSGYAEAYQELGRPDLAAGVVEEGLASSQDPRLLLRGALIALDHGDRERGLELMRRSAEGGHPPAMSNLARLRLQEGHGDEAVQWARKAVAAAPLYAKGYRTLGVVLLALHHPDEALAALERASRLAPTDLGTRYDLALVLIELHRDAEARGHLEAASSDPAVGMKARAALARLTDRR